MLSRGTPKHRSLPDQRLLRLSGQPTARAVVLLTNAMLAVVALIAIVPVASGVGKS